MLNNFERIEILSEILPFIQKFSGQIVVIKYGGSTMKDTFLKEKVIEDILFLASVGLKPVLVHGGGPIIDSWLKKINIEPKFDNGIRVTDAATMEIVEMVLGKVNKDLVSLINRKNGKAVGLSGKDANLIVAKAATNSSFNLVGKVSSVNSEIIHLLIDKKYIPVIASVATGTKGETYNINADIVAGSIASALQANRLVLLTDTPGIMSNLKNNSTIFTQLSIAQAEKLKNINVISGGMIPKVDSCIHAVNNGVNSAHIIDGRLQHALLLTILTNNAIGSTLKSDI